MRVPQLSPVGSIHAYALLLIRRRRGTLRVFRNGSAVTRILSRVGSTRIEWTDFTDEGAPMRSDTDLVDKVFNELLWDLDVDNDATAVSVEARTVTLRGIVGSLREMRAAK